MKAHVSVIGPKIFVASVGTRHFTFTGYGSTKAEARKALEQVWRDHCWQYRSQGVDVHLWTELKTGITVSTFWCGRGYRDGQPVEAR